MVTVSAGGWTQTYRSGRAVSHIVCVLLMHLHIRSEFRPHVLRVCQFEACHEVPGRVVAGYAIWVRQRIQPENSVLCHVYHNESGYMTE